jgi:hypothetical protein
VKQDDKFGPAGANGLHLINLRFQTAGKQPGKLLQILAIAHLRTQLMPDIAAIVAYGFTRKSSAI